jgi:hypothetical protein
MIFSLLVAEIFFLVDFILLAVEYSPLWVKLLIWRNNFILRGDLFIYWFV